MTHNRIMAAKALVDNLHAEGQTSHAEYVEELMNECLKLRQGLWDVARICGGDGDGNDTPVHLVSSIVLFAKNAATDLKEKCDEQLSLV